MNSQKKNGCRYENLICYSMVYWGVDALTVFFCVKNGLVYFENNSTLDLV